MLRLFTYLFCITTIISPISAQLLDGDYNQYINFHWKGALTSHSITLKVFPQPELFEDKLNTFLVLYTNPLKVSSIKLIKEIKFTNEDYPVEEVKLTGLEPDTEYFYSFAFTKDDELEESEFITYSSKKSLKQFTFQTFGIALEPYNFTFGAASCASTGSESEIFLHIKEQNFQFFIHMGDLHYDDIEENDATLYYDAYHSVFDSKTQKEFFSHTPVSYTWDDHDFGPNDSNGNSLGKIAAHITYKAYVVYPDLKNYLPADDSADIDGAPAAVRDATKLPEDYAKDDPFGVFRSYIVGRCLFIQLDLRAFKDVTSNNLLGKEQFAWLKNQIVFAGLNEGIQGVFLVSSFPWIGVWDPYVEEQKEIAKWIKEHIQDKGKEIFAICGDAHMIAFDDGSNNQYGGFPVIQSAAMARCFSCKGGPYSHGAKPGKGQFGVMKAIDNGTNICLNISLRRNDRELIAYDTCNPQKYEKNQMSCGDAYVEIMMPAIVAAIVLLIIAFVLFVYYRKMYKAKSVKEIWKKAHQKLGTRTDGTEMTERNINSKDENRALTKLEEGKEGHHLD